ncbi:MAG: hypothetical protein WB869_15135, partial [Candidatus Acidiferrales bacterium]
YYAALQDLARVQTARQHYSEAVDLLRQRNSKFPTASSRYALAQALDRAGETTAAVLAYADFTTTALPLIGASENANEELVFYYLGRGHDPAEALRIAQLEIARRHDVNTLDAYAWALSGNGRNQDAQKQIALALAVGVREAKIFYHAGTIAANLGDDAAATRYLGQAVELDPTSESAAASREALQKLAPKPTTARGAK